MFNEDFRGYKYAIDSVWIDRRFGLEVTITNIKKGINNDLYTVEYSYMEYLDSHNIEYMDKYFIESTTASRILYIDSNVEYYTPTYYKREYTMSDLIRLATDGNKIEGAE